MSAPDWFAVIDATWPAADFHRVAGWIVREGQGGGKRVSAASGSGDISEAEAAQRALGQDLLFMIQDGQNALDTELEDRGYQIIDPVVVLARSLRSETIPASPSEGATDASLAIWDKGGIGPARRAVMDRANGPKTVVQQDGGVAFVSCHDDVAMIHALEVDAAYRRQGVGAELEHTASAWAPTRKIAALTVESNIASRRLFQNAGYCVVSRYHYRIKL